MAAADFSRPGSLYGAVDLGARKAALDAQARREAAAQDPAAGGASTVIEVTAATFNADVVERSLSVPVIVEATVPRAEQVQQFSQTLEKLAAEVGGAWILARVDVEANPELAQALRMRAVPTVYLAVQGQLMPLFEGPLPEPQLRQALTQVFEQLGVELSAPAADEAPGEPPADPDLLAADEALERGDLDAAAAAFERLIAKSPADQDAKIGLAGVGLLRRTQGLDPADVQRRALENPADVVLQTQAADLDLLGGDVDAAFDRLIGAVRRMSGDDRDKARMHLLGLFEALPADDPSVAKGRRGLANALF